MATIGQSSETYDSASKEGIVYSQQYHALVVVKLSTSVRKEMIFDHPKALNLFAHWNRR
jgi:hypothetical protein